MDLSLNDLNRLLSDRDFAKKFADSIDIDKMPTVDLTGDNPIRRLGLGNCQCEHANHRSTDEPELKNPTQSHPDHFYGHGCATKIVLTTWGTYEMCEGCAQDAANSKFFVKFLANHSEA